MSTQELDEVVTLDGVWVDPEALGTNDALEPQPQTPLSRGVVPENKPKLFECLDFPPGGIFTINDDNADTSCVFFWLYVMAFVGGLVCLFVGCD
jgi:hypothetical protein